MRFQSSTPSSGWKNAVDRLDLAAPGTRRLAEPQLVERADRQRVEQAVREPRSASGRNARVARTRARWRARRFGQLVERRVVAAGEHRPAEVRGRVRGSRSTRPSSGSGRRCRACAPCSRRRRAARSVSTDHVRGLDRLELQRRFGDDAGEAHAARRRPEHVGSVSGPTASDAAGRRDELQPLDVVAEAIRGGTCRGCRRRSRRRRSRSACRARPSGTSRAGRARASACRGSTPASTVHRPFSRSTLEDAVHVGEAQHRRRPRSARRRRSCGRARARARRAVRRRSSRATTSSTRRGCRHRARGRGGAAPAGEQLGRRAERVSHPCARPPRTSRPRRRRWRAASGRRG